MILTFGGGKGEKESECWDGTSGNGESEREKVREGKKELRELRCRGIHSVNRRKELRQSILIRMRRSGDQSRG